MRSDVNCDDTDVGVEAGGRDRRKEGGREEGREGEREKGREKGRKGEREKGRPGYIPFGLSRVTRQLFNMQILIFAITPKPLFCASHPPFPSLLFSLSPPSLFPLPSTLSPLPSSLFRQVKYLITNNTMTGVKKTKTKTKKHWTPSNRQA